MMSFDTMFFLALVGHDRSEDRSMVARWTRRDIGVESEDVPSGRTCS